MVITLTWYYQFSTLKKLSYVFRRQGSANESTSARSIPKGFWREFHKDAAVLAPEKLYLRPPILKVNQTELNKVTKYRQTKDTESNKEKEETWARKTFSRVPAYTIHTQEARIRRPLPPFFLRTTLKRILSPLKYPIVQSGPWLYSLKACTKAGKVFGVIYCKLKSTFDVESEKQNRTKKGEVQTDRQQAGKASKIENRK